MAQAALSFYQAPELIRRAKTSIANMRLARGGSGGLSETVAEGA